MKTVSKIVLSIVLVLVTGCKRDKRITAIEDILPETVTSMSIEHMGFQYQVYDDELMNQYIEELKSIPLHVDYEKVHDLDGGERILFLSNGADEYEYIELDSVIKYAKNGEILGEAGYVAKGEEALGLYVYFYREIILRLFNDYKKEMIVGNHHTALILFEVKTDQYSYGPVNENDWIKPKLYYEQMDEKTINKISLADFESVVVDGVECASLPTDIGDHVVFLNDGKVTYMYLYNIS